MDYRIMNPAERKYTFRQSQQISMQTGLIGYLRADFGSTGKEFYSTWNDFRKDLKTDDFKKEFDLVISWVIEREQNLLKMFTRNPDNEADRPVSNPRAPRRQSTVMGDGLYAKYYIGYANRRGSYEPRRFMLSLLLHPDSHRNLQAVSRLFRYRTFFFHSFYYFPNR